MLIKKALYIKFISKGVGTKDQVLNTRKFIQKLQYHSEKQNVERHIYKMLTKIPCTNDSILKNQLWYKIYFPQINELIFDSKTVLIIYLYMKKMKMKKKPNDLNYLLIKH